MCAVIRILLLIVFIESAVTSSYARFDDVMLKHMPCPELHIANGRVRLRSRGRMAKFICKTGYRLFGRSYITCLRGRWNFPPPFCASRDCFALPHPANGRMSVEARGAIQRFSCNPGYELFGSLLTYCSDGNWNSTLPSCKPKIKNPLLSCDFEHSDMCDWTHDYSDDFDWKRYSSTTPSGHIGTTGPSSDHTLGPGRSGYYIYIEASSPRKENDTARLFSPVYPPEFSNNTCFQFWYHMYGSATGGLNVYFKPESNDITELIPMFSLFGNQGNKWFPGFLELSSITEPFQIVIEGIRGSEYSSDIAIDDVTLKVGQSCDSFTSTAVMNGPSIANSTAPVATLGSAELTSAVTVTSPSPKLQTSNATVFLSTVTRMTAKSATTSTPATTNPPVANASLSIKFTTASPKRSSVTGPPGSTTVTTPTIKVVATTATSRIPMTVNSSATTASTSSIKSVTQSSTPSSTMMSNHIPTPEQPEWNGLPPWKVLNRSDFFPEDFKNNMVQPLTPQAQTANNVVSVPTAIGIAAVALVTIVIVGVAARGIYQRRKLWRDSLNEDSDVRYLKDCEVRVEFHDRNFKSYEDGL